ncbi:hypothetical protein I8G32_00124 [Rhodopseudomonas palustris]|uniref:Uncharacterized protein n=1 Tax=Rhodopseudomonas palustris (strain ATCC BAA-98 / CGA009) TaxID=258594 RepID=A0AAE9XT94_RHOPA|nr:hypothetical protein [Rhodopseudomonas palustris]QQM01609.1 hypothetical protein I8G32_00124 [Rhodopseudomonas palustris]WAB77838.1 hypothetical protein OR798_00625 [Rhodopseudomonas palustris]WCL90244.1 hypothetical protein TX73_000625 [Rhodopseudomonas palustris CGA009]WND51749.1 hypothetical protein L1A21_00625 [Rhodopseudomonas palustris]
MPKKLSDYTLADWKRLRPLSQGLKTARYNRIDRRYRQQPAKVGDPAAVAKMITGRRALFTVAYQDPQAIDLQIPLIRLFVPDAVYIVVDNSPDDDRAAEIERIAKTHGVPYLRAPDNPWQKSSRSHGIVLNWTWHNIIRPGAPELFGLLDHDLFPTAPDDPFAPLGTQDVYGYVRTTEPPSERWFLWAGFTMMRFSAGATCRSTLARTGSSAWIPAAATGVRCIASSTLPSCSNHPRASCRTGKVSPPMTDRFNGAAAGCTKSARWASPRSCATSAGWWLTC